MRFFWLKGAVNGFVQGTIFRKSWIFTWNTGLSCKLSLKTIHWSRESAIFFYVEMGLSEKISFVLQIMGCLNIVSCWNTMLWFSLKIQCPKCLWQWFWRLEGTMLPFKLHFWDVQYLWTQPYFSEPILTQTQQMFTHTGMLAEPCKVLHWHWKCCVLERQFFGNAQVVSIIHTSLLYIRIHTYNLNSRQGQLTTRHFHLHSRGAPLVPGSMVRSGWLFVLLWIDLYHQRSLYYMNHTSDWCGFVPVMEGVYIHARFE